MSKPTVGQIVRDRREALGLTLTALAAEVGATKSYLSMIENHRVANPPAAVLLRQLERALDIAPGELQRAAAWQNTPPEVRDAVAQLTHSAQAGQDLARWLLTNADPRRQGGRSLDKLFRSGTLAQRIRQTLDPEPTAHKNIAPIRAIRYQVPLINKVAAGYPRDFTDLDYPARHADDTIDVPDLNDPQAFAARIVGDSMTPDYREGDIVVFSPAAKVADGSDCFVRLLPDNTTTFKRIFFDRASGNGKEQIRLQPLNPQFAPTIHAREQIAGLYKAVARIQSLI